MKVRMNMDSCKNALGTVFLLATAFFVCSTFISMRSVFADPIVPESQKLVRNSNTSQRVKQITPKRTVSRSVSNRSVSTQPVTAATAKAASRSIANRNVSARSNVSNRVTNSGTRNVVSRSQITPSTRNTNTRAVRARSNATTSRVSVTGTAMNPGMRASSGSYTYLTSKLYSGTYSNIIDSATGLIAADAYSNCLESYYTCMDEICTARSDTKGRCSCAGRATNFLAAEDALEEANEELIKLSGQLSLLISTKGKADDLAAAFSLTDAEKVMNCVSYKEAADKQAWCDEHPTFTDAGTLATCAMPSYCSESGNSFGFDIRDIDGSSSDILAQLKAWADAKDLAKQYTTDDTNNLVARYANISGFIDSLTGITSSVDAESAALDSLANKWGYKLFEYAHNNVCGRVLDSCFNGIYESCGNPGTVTDSDNKTHSKCGNGSVTNCPFNYNSYISVNSSTGDVVLNERGASSATESSVASCFGYSSSSTTTTDPYAAVRGPVADARRSIMQKYLLDANSACDAYGAALKQTAQNINYQKIAAEQALQQKRLEFKQEEESKTFAEATTAITNCNECISEIWDCYQQYEGQDKWTTARIKSYCAQVSQVPHCYETMICAPLKTQMVAVVDLPDQNSCANTDDYSTNTCRNVVTISEILYGAGNATASAALRESCLVSSLNCDSDDSGYCLRNWTKTKTYTISYYDAETGVKYTNMTPVSYSTTDLPMTVTPTTPTKAGYTFMGWCSESDYQENGNECDKSMMITLTANTSGAKVYYATWNEQ